MSAHTDTTVIADSVECSLCCDEVKSSQVVVDFCADYIDHGTVCRACMTYYITDKINSSFLGACPSMHCPCVHVGGVRKFLKFPNWKHVVGTSIYSKYEKLAESLVAFLCGSCHALKSLLIRYNPTGTEHLADQMPAEAYSKLLASMNRYVNGEEGLEEIYSMAIPQAFPGFTGALSDREAFDCMTAVLSCIANPERRANLQLRHYRARPRIWTHCCSKEHCYRCQTKDFHEGRSCEEHRNTLGVHLYDSSTVDCPSCGVCLAKGDGCNSVVCVCGRQFQWQTEKVLAENCHQFAQSHPQDTSWAAVRVLCRSTLESPNYANAWRQRHTVETNKGFLRWWREQYPHCPTQCSVIMQYTQTQTHPPARYGNSGGYTPGYGYGSAIDGVREARELWRATHATSVARREAQRAFAIDAVFEALAPPTQRAAAAVRLISNLYTRNEASSAGQQQRYTNFANCLWVSAQHWVNRNYALYKQARFEHDCRSAMQFLYLYGGRSVTHTVPSHIESGHVLSAGKMRRFGLYYTTVTQWDRRCSNEFLTFRDGDTAVSRDGGVSCYPAAIAPLPNSQSMITIRIDACPRSCNILSFGISCRPPQMPANISSTETGTNPTYLPSIAPGASRELFPKHNSHGVGRIANTYGMVDERQTSYISSSNDSPSSSTHTLLFANVERAGNFRKLRQGDILQGVVNTEEGWFDLHLDGCSTSGSGDGGGLDRSLVGTVDCDPRDHWYHRFQIPSGPADDFAFAVTMANDHRLSIVEASAAVNHHHNTASVALRGVSTNQSSNVPVNGSVSSPPPPMPCYVAPNPGHLAMMERFRKLLEIVQGTPLKNSEADNPTSTTCSFEECSSNSESEEVLHCSQRQAYSALHCSHRQAYSALKAIAGSCVEHCPHFVSETQQMLTLVAPYARYWEKLCTAHATELFTTPEPVEVSLNSSNLPSPRSPHRSETYTTNGQTRAQFAIYAHCDESHAPDECPENSNRFTAITAPSLGCPCSTLMEDSGAGAGASASTEAGAHTDAGPLHVGNTGELTALAMAVLTSFQAREDLTPQLSRCTPAVRSLLTWEHLLAAACFDRRRREAAHTANSQVLAAGFLMHHGADSVFMAAAICAGVTGHSRHDASARSCSSTVPAPPAAPAPRDAALAFMATYPFEMHEWYDDNASSADPLLVDGGKAAIIKECRCLPRHFKSQHQRCPASGA